MQVNQAHVHAAWDFLRKIGNQLVIDPVHSYIKTAHRVFHFNDPAMGIQPLGYYQDLAKELGITEEYKASKVQGRYIEGEHIAEVICKRIAELTGLNCTAMRTTDAVWESTVMLIKGSESLKAMEQQGVELGYLKKDSGPMTSKIIKSGVEASRPR